MNRNITGTIRKTDGTVWDGAVLEFELERSSYDESAQYPNRVVRAIADEQGEIAVSLWVNEDALRPSRYICTLPDGSQFRFTLPTGFGAADLNQLRETAVEDDSPTQSSLVAFLPVVRIEAQTVVNQAISGFEAEIDEKADQSALDATNTNVTTLTAGLAAVDADLGTKANQEALDNTDASVAQMASDLNSLAHDVGNKASRDDLNTTNVNLQAVSDDVFNAFSQIATKAAQSSLDTTNANVSSLTTGLASANSAIATKAAQSSLNTTNSDLAALTTVVGTKAAQSALNTAIANLQNAIASAQSMLEGLIGQKADLEHTHASSEIAGDHPNAIGYFDNSSQLTCSDQLVFSHTLLGLGTSDPQHTLDLQHPGAIEGSQSRIIVNLDSSAPDIHLIADPNLPAPPTISFECNGVVNVIDSDANGNFGLGTDGVTPAVIFRMLQGSFSFLGMQVGFDDPSDLIFPPLSWGFYKQPTHFGFGDAAFYLVFHDGDTLQVLSFSGK